MFRRSGAACEVTEQALKGGRHYLGVVSVQLWSEALSAAHFKMTVSKTMFHTSSLRTEGDLGKDFAIAVSWVDAQIHSQVSMGLWAAGLVICPKTIPKTPATASPIRFFEQGN